MATVVLDSSFVLEWALDQKKSRERRALFELILSQPVVVPSIWLLEMGNVLVQSQKSGALSVPLEKAVAALWNLSVTVDDTRPETAWGPVVELARRHRLSVYDASYLELARRRKALLATLDAALIEAAHKEGVEVWSAGL